MTLPNVTVDRTDARPATVAAIRALSLCAGVVAALTLALLPLLAVTIPPFFDYANHLARVDILTRLGDEAFLDLHYRFTSYLVPNMLSDLVMLGFRHLTDADTAGRLLVGLTFALTITGTLVLTRVATGRFSVFGLIAAILVSNDFVFWGFLNYNLGVALIPWALAGWLALDRASTLLRFFVGTVAALLTAGAHLVAFGLYAVAIAVLELDRAWRHRRAPLATTFGRLIASALQFVPVLALYVAISPSRGLAIDLQFDFGAWAKLSPFTRLISSGNLWLDTPLLVGCVALIVLALLTGIARLHRGLALVALAWLALAMALPYSALGSFFLDARIAIAIAFIAVAAVATPPLAPRAAATVAALILAALGLRAAVLTADWRDQDARLAELRAAFAALPRDSLLMAAHGRGFELGDWTTTRRIKPAYEHAATYAVIDRHAFVPNVFARAGQNPLVLEPRNEAIQDLATNPIRRAYNAQDLYNLARWLAAARPTFGGSGRAFALAYFHDCDDWPARAHVRIVACGRDFSLVEVTDDTPPMVIDPRSEDAE